MNLRALLVDGGATLFPEGLTVPEFALIGPARSLAGVLPELDQDELRNLLKELRRSQQATELEGIQPGDLLTAKLLDAARLGLGAKASAVRHPLNSAGRFADDRPDPFVIGGSYLQRHRYVDSIERDGLRMTCHSEGQR
jgi:hypothetical protein